MVYEFMTVFKSTFLVLLIFWIAVVSWPCAAKTYMHPERIYSFEYPKSWTAKRHQSSNTVFFGPSSKKGGVFCFSRPERMTGNSSKAKVEDLVKANLEAGVLQEAIRAADPEAGKIETSIFNTANSMASRMIFESKNRNGVVKKVAMTLTYNLNTGHTIDITCQSPEGQWHKHGKVFGKIQSSLHTYNQPAIQAMEGPDFVGSKKKWVFDALDAIRKNITKFRLRDGSYVPQETAEELGKPLLAYEDAKRVYNRGILSGMAEYCELDWQNKSFTPFMRSERAKRVWSGKELAVIGALHGRAQGNTLEGLQRRGKCPAEFGKKAQAMLGKLK